MHRYASMCVALSRLFLCRSLCLSRSVYSCLCLSLADALCIYMCVLSAASLYLDVSPSRYLYLSACPSIAGCRSDVSLKSVPANTCRLRAPAEPIPIQQTPHTLLRDLRGTVPHTQPQTHMRMRMHHAHTPTHARACRVWSGGTVLMAHDRTTAPPPLDRRPHLRWTEEWLNCATPLTPRAM